MNPSKINLTHRDRLNMLGYCRAKAAECKSLSDLMASIGINGPVRQREIQLEFAYSIIASDLASYPEEYDDSQTLPEDRVWCVVPGARPEPCVPNPPDRETPK
jgi:hypothetical protein